MASGFFQPRRSLAWLLPGLLFSLISPVPLVVLQPEKEVPGAVPAFLTRSLTRLPVDRRCIHPRTSRPWSMPTWMSAAGGLAISPNTRAQDNTIRPRYGFVELRSQSAIAPPGLLDCWQLRKDCGPTPVRSEDSEKNLEVQSVKRARSNVRLCTSPVALLGDLERWLA